jgi:hypothetical protein
MTPGSVIVPGIIIGVALAATGMIWNAIHLVRLGRASVPAVRLYLGGFAIMPIAGGLAALMLAPRLPFLYVGAVGFLATGVAAIAIAFRVRVGG